MANKQRGEMNIKLCGKDYVLRPTMEALAEIEDRSDISLTKILLRLANADARMKDVASVIYAGLKGAGTDISYERAMQMVYETGPLELLKSCADFLKLALSRESEGEESKEGEQEKKEVKT